MKLNEAQAAVVAAARKALKKPIVTYMEIREWAQKTLKTEYAPQYIIKNEEMWARDAEGNKIRGLYMLVAPGAQAEFAGMRGRPLAAAKAVAAKQRRRKPGVSIKVEATEDRVQEAFDFAEKILRKGAGSASGRGQARRTGTR